MGTGYRVRGFEAVFLLASVLAIAPLWVAEKPPLVDLPQHAGQLAIGAAWEDQPWLQQVYEPNLWANQLVVPALVWAFQGHVAVLDALRIVLSLAILAFLAAVWLWIRDAGGDRWWVFLVLPTVYGYALRWGFVSFCLAVPLSLVVLLGLRRFGERPSWRLALALSGGVIVLFFTHVLMLVWLGAVGGGLALTMRVPQRVRFAMLAILAIAVPLLLVWWFGGGSPSTGMGSAISFGHERGITVLSSIVGWPAGPWAAGFGLVLLAAPWAFGARPHRETWRWIPLAATVGFLGLVPLEAFGTALLYPRYALLLLPTLLIALRPTRSRRLVVAAVIAAALVWQVVVIWTFRRFDAESRDAVAMLERIPARARVLGIIERPASEAVPWYPYLHFAQWYQAEGGGVVDFSFSDFFPARYRYRPEARSGLPAHSEWRPEALRWDRHRGEIYDFVVLRRAVAWPSPRSVGPAPARAGDRLELVARAGEWELWRRSGTRGLVPAGDSGDQSGAAVAGDVAPGPLDQDQ